MDIRPETPDDYQAVHQLHAAAFGRAAEADLVDRLRGVASTLSVVATDAIAGVEQIVGHIFFSPVTIAISGAQAGLILGLAPVAVRPDYQRQGIGSRLIRQGLEACAQIGCKAVVVLGAPDYYGRFGFVTAKTMGLGCEYPVPDEAFMVLELEPGALHGYAGIVKYRAEFADLE